MCIRDRCSRDLSTRRILMEYRRFNQTIIVRMDKGEEILANIKNVALAEGIKPVSYTHL